MIVYPFFYETPRHWDQLSSEIQVQMSCRDWIAKTLCRTTCFAVPNASKRTRWQAMNAKREGMVKGVVDLVVVGKPGLVAFCEIKAGGVVSPEQKTFLEQMVGMGHNAGVFRSVDSFARQLTLWGFQ